MQIIVKDNKNILIKDNNEEVNISNNNIIKYKAICYKSIEIETMFIGKIDSYRYRFDVGITGIYIEPLYVMHDEWIKITNLKPPEQKYFLYPHLLLLPNEYYHYKPLYFLHTCENVDINDFIHITKNMEL